MLEVEDVGADAGDDVGGVAGFAAVAADLCEAGDTGLHESADTVRGGDFLEDGVVLHHMRARANDAHFSFEDVDELRR